MRLFSSKLPISSSHSGQHDLLANCKHSRSLSGLFQVMIPRTFHSTARSFHLTFSRSSSITQSLRAHSTPTNKPPQASTHRPGGQGDRLRFFPFLVIFLACSGTYVWMVKSRASQPQPEISGETRKTGRYQR